MPYDPPSQAAWMSSPTTDGYPAFLVGPHITWFTGYGLGSYCYFQAGSSTLEGWAASARISNRQRRPLSAVPNGSAVP